MKPSLNKYIIILLPAFLLGLACRKTDSYYQQLSGTPEIYTTLGLDYSRDLHGNGQQYHVGDTLRINGRFNAGASDITVAIGGVNAPVIGLLKKDSTPVQNQVTYYKSVETIRVVLTDAMGTGRLPVKVTCRGFGLDGPLLFLVPKGALPAVTDTLVWKQFFSFRAFNNVPANPALVDSFLANPIFYPCYSGNGNIWFSKKTKIQLLQPDGSIQQVADLQGLSDTYGPFSITKMYNGAVDQQEHTLYFSALTSDSYKTPGSNGTATDADSNWIFRYCKLDLQSGRLQVQNRTIVPIYSKNFNAMGTLAQIQALYAQEGDVSQVKLPLFTMAWADNSGDVYFSPISMSLSNLGFNGTTGKVNYYASVSDLNRTLYLGKITPDGQVHYLTKAKADWPGTGVVSAFSPARNTILSFDPAKGIMFSVQNVSGNDDISAFDPNSHSLLGELYPKTTGAGATGPFNLLDKITPASGAAINYSGLGGDNGSLLSLPGSANRFLYDAMNVVYDFSISQAYHYAPAILDSIQYLVHSPASYDGPLALSRSDVPGTMLNFDQQGNLYRVCPFYQTFGATATFYYDVRRTYIVQH